MPAKSEGEPGQGWCAGRGIARPQGPTLGVAGGRRLQRPQDAKAGEPRAPPVGRGLDMAGGSMPPKGPPEARKRTPEAP